MTAKAKIFVAISAAPETECLENCDMPRFLIADAIVQTTERRRLTVVELRMIVPALSANAMLRGMLEGETEIAITGMSPLAGLQ